MVSLASKSPTKYQPSALAQDSPYLQQLRSPTKVQPFNSYQDSYGRSQYQSNRTLLSFIVINYLILLMNPYVARSPTKVQPSQMYQDSPYAKPPPILLPSLAGGSVGVSSGLGINRRLLGPKVPSNHNISPSGISGGAGTGSYQPRKVDRPSDVLPAVLPPLQLAQTQAQPRKRNPNGPKLHRAIFG